MMKLAVSEAVLVRATHGARKLRRRLLMDWMLTWVQWVMKQQTACKCTHQNQADIRQFVIQKRY